MVAGSLISQPADAETRTTSVTAMPAVVDVGGEAGKETRFSFQITNNGQAALPIHMSTKDSRVREGQTKELMQALSAKGWVVYDEPDFILQARETRQVLVTLKIPKDASPGGHYAELMVRSLSLERDDGVIATQPELAVQMFVTVAGNLREDLKISAGGPSTMFFNSAASNFLTFNVTNDGNIHTLFTPKLQLKHKRQEDVVAKSQPELLLPGEKKQVSFELPSGLRPGLHTTKMFFSYGTPSKEAESHHVRVMLLPFSPKLLLLIPLVAIAIYAYRIRQRIISAIRILTEGNEK